MSEQTNIAAVVLAAGKGKRMKSKIFNKVVLNLGEKPMILYTIELLEKLQIKPIVVVVGFAKNSVMSILGNRVIFAEQRKRLGTAHATECGLKKLNSKIADILVLNGDDSAFYTENLIEKLLETHLTSGAALTFLTITLEDPSGLGRIIRGKNGEVLAVVEEKDATEEQKKIKEVNPACYLLKKNFLKKYLKKVKKSKITGEYYLVDLVGLAVSNKEKVEAVKMKGIPWRGVNTEEELKEARRLFYGHS